MFCNFLHCANIIGVKNFLSSSITRCFSTGFMLLLNSRGKKLEVFMSRCLVGTFLNPWPEYSLWLSLGA
jgi:hypothetical protein